jgi:hypothetical protein
MIRRHPRWQLREANVQFCGRRAHISPAPQRQNADGRKPPLCLIIVLVASVLIGGKSEAGGPSKNPAIGIAGATSPLGPYGRWTNGPPKRADFFPIGVWLQSPNHIAEFKQLGINTFVGFWGTLDQTSLASFARAGIGLIPMQNSLGLTSAQRTAIVGWAQSDEPDNAQQNGTGGSGQCLTPAQIVGAYNAIRANDTTRPVFLNFGRGVSNTDWIGRGSCTGQTASYYPKAVAGGDVISFDIYPVAEYSGRLEMVPQGVDNLKSWLGASHASKVIWSFVEGAPIFSGPRPSPAQVAAEVWMPIIHGSQGIVYFVHQFSANGSRLIRADGIFNFPSLLSAVTSINREITALAPVLNSPIVVNRVSVLTPASTPISVLVKQYSGSIYVFAAAMRNKGGTATFTVHNVQRGIVRVLNEGRLITLFGGAFQDSFEGYGVHLYRISTQ